MAKLSSHSSHPFSQHLTSQHHDKASPQPATTPTHGSLHLPQMLSPSYQPSPSSNSHNRKVRCSSESKALFRPFDDKDTSKSSTGEIKTDDHVNRSSSNIYLGSLLSNTSHTNHPAILSIPSIKVSSHISSSQAATEKQPPLSLTNDSKVVDPISSYVRNKVERFDFKSLARECTSAKVSETVGGEAQSQAAENSTADNKQTQFLSKLDHEAKRRSKRKLKSDADSDNEVDVEDRMMIRLTMIGRVTPIPLDICPEKMELLEYLGVTTWENKNGEYTY